MPGMESVTREIKASFESMQTRIDGLINDGLTSGLQPLQSKLEACIASMDTKASIEALGDLRNSMKLLQDRIEEVAQNAADGASPDRPPFGEQAKSFADYVKNLPIVQRAKEEGPRFTLGHMPDFGSGLLKRQDPGEAPSLLFPREKKTLTATQLGPFSLPRYRIDPVLAPGLPIGLIDRIPYVAAPGARDYRFTKETNVSRRGYVYTTLDGAVTGGAGATATFTNVEGVTPGASWTFHGTTNETKVVDSVNPTTRVVTFTTTIVNSFDSGAYVTAKEWGGIAEAAAKPYGWFAGEEVTRNFLLIPVLVSITEQQFQTIDGLESKIESRLATHTRENVEWHLINGDAASNADQLYGFLADTDSAQTQWSLLESGATRVDAMLRSALECELRGYGNVEFAMNHLDWHLLKTQKTSAGEYLNTMNSPIKLTMLPDGRMALDRYPVNLTIACPAAYPLAIDHGRASELVDRQLDQFAIGYVNDDFAKNKLCLRYEVDVLHAILDSNAFQRVYLDAAP